MELNFNKWLVEYINYEKNQKDNKKSEPWKDFKTHLFTDEIKRLILGDNKRILIGWEEEVRWEEGDQIFEININPFGSLRITARKEIKDFDGNKVRICKFVYPINDFKINQEIDLANKIYNRIKKISNKNIDYPVKNYNLKKLAYNLYEKLNNEYPTYIMFPVKLMEMNKNYYKIVFEFKGQGVGVPGNSVAMQFNVDLSFNKDLGFIRCWGYNIDSPSKKRQYKIQPSEWDELFSCKQNPKRIIDMIATTLSTY